MWFCIWNKITNFCLRLPNASSTLCGGLPSTRRKEGSSSAVPKEGKESLLEKSKMESVGFLDRFWFWLLKLVQIDIGSSGLWVALGRRGFMGRMWVGGFSRRGLWAVVGGFAQHGWVVCSVWDRGFCSLGFLWVLCVLLAWGFLGLGCDLFYEFGFWI